NTTGITLDGGKLARVTSGGEAFNRLFTVGPNGGTLEGSTGYIIFNSTGTPAFTGAGDRTLTLSSGSQTQDELFFKLAAPSGDSTFDDNASSGSDTLNLGNGDATASFSGKITGSQISLAKNGLGTQTLSGANTYGGATTVNAGVLRFNSATSIGGSGASMTVN